jgi:hypothetical protein
LRTSIFFISFHDSSLRKLTTGDVSAAVFVAQSALMVLAFAPLKEDLAAAVSSLLPVAFKHLAALAVMVAERLGVPITGFLKLALVLRSFILTSLSLVSLTHLRLEPY